MCLRIMYEHLNGYYKSIVFRLRQCATQINYSGLIG